MTDSPTGRAPSPPPEFQDLPRYGGKLEDYLRQSRSAQAILAADYSALEQRVLAAGGKIYCVMDEVIVVSDVALD